MRFQNENLKIFTKFKYLYERLKIILLGDGIYEILKMQYMWKNGGPIK